MYMPLGEGTLRLTFFSLWGSDPLFQDGKTYNKWRAYGQAKTANMLMAISLAEKLGDKGLIAVSLHPGVIWTNLGTHLDWSKDLAEISELPTASPPRKMSPRYLQTTIVLTQSVPYFSRPQQGTRELSRRMGKFPHEDTQPRSCNAHSSGFRPQSERLVRSSGFSLPGVIVVV